MPNRINNADFKICSLLKYLKKILKSQKKFKHHSKGPLVSFGTVYHHLSLPLGLLHIFVGEL